MRDILFKAKRDWIEPFNDKWWVEGSLLKQVHDKRKCNYYEEKARIIETTYYILEEKVSEHWEGCGMGEHTVTDQKKYLVDPKTISQYIGMSDINGKKIFENDLVRITIHDYSTDKVLYETIEKVEYREDKAKFGVVYGFQRVFSGLDEFVFTTFEVVGNVFDNPELLEV